MQGVVSKKLVKLCKKCEMQTIHRIEKDGRECCTKCAKYPLKELLQRIV